MRVVYLINQKFQDCNSINDSPCSYLCITIQLVGGVFCDRLKFGSTAALDCRTVQNKGRYVLRKNALIATHFFGITVVQSYDCTMVGRKESRCPRFKLQTQIKATKSLFGRKKYIKGYLSKLCKTFCKMIITFF